MKIAILTRSTVFHKKSGGMETQALGLAEGLVKLNHQVYVVTTALVEDHTEVEGHGVCYVFLSGTKPGEYSQEFWQKSSDWVREKVSQGEIDVVIGESAGAAGYVLSGEKKVPVVEIAHGSLISEVLTVMESVDSVRGLLRFGLKTLPYAIRTYLTLDLPSARKVDLVVAVSETVAKEIRKTLFLKKEKVRVVFNGIDTEKFRIYSPREIGKIREGLGYSHSDLVLLCLGRLIKEKGVQDVISVLPNLPEHVKLVVVGEGTYKEELRAKSEELNVASRVRWVGAVNYDKTPDYYNGADIFVLPTHRREGLPMTLLEAQACGLPVVVANKGGASEAVAIGETGFIYAYGDLLELQGCSNKLVTSPPLREEMSHNARKRAEELFSQEIMVRKIVEVLQQV